jgi:hypothetical protein
VSVAAIRAGRQASSPLVSSVCGKHIMRRRQGRAAIASSINVLRIMIQKVCKKLRHNGFLDLNGFAVNPNYIIRRTPGI